MKNQAKAYEKISLLLKLNPQSREMKTALKHFSSAALIAELQRRDEMPPNDHPTAWLDNTALSLEAQERDFLLIDKNAYKEAIDNEDLESLVAFYWEN
jgi:hypothetical protein